MLFFTSMNALMTLDHEKRGNDDDVCVHEAKKCENHIEAWRFIYSVYHGKCLSLVFSAFYGCAGNADPPTCFISYTLLNFRCTHNTSRKV